MPVTLILIEKTHLKYEETLKIYLISNTAEGNILYQEDLTLGSRICAADYNPDVLYEWKYSKNEVIFNFFNFFCLKDVYVFLMTEGMDLDDSLIWDVPTLLS